MLLFDKNKLKNFYIDHLKNNILSFWLPRCIDKKYGGYLNCYDNTGENLISTNKFIWSQGRFVWTFSKLASMEPDIFTQKERKTFIDYANNGIEFLRKNAIMKEKFACTYLTDRQGNHLYSSEEKVYDASIYADCFVIAGFSRYAFAASDTDCFNFAKKLYQSVVDRIDRKDYRVLPFVRPKGRKMHGIPMICLNTAAELYDTAQKLGLDNSRYKKDMKKYYTEIMENFCDDNYLIHEIITEENTFTDDILGRHINPGHSIEDLWFILEAANSLGDKSYNDKCFKILKKTLNCGWDEKYGGILLYADIDGGKPKGSMKGVSEDENMVGRIKNYWDSKLYWVHSESLYTTLLCYMMTGDEDFWQKYKRIHDYTFKVFPNQDKNIGEWIQVRMRNGNPDNKLVGLPVKDPFHITRNLVKVIEILES